MRKINVLLLDEQDYLLKDFQKKNNIRYLDEAINEIILVVKNHIEGSK